MDFSFTDTFDKQMLLETMMGPNAMRITEELTSFFTIPRGARILDLGCGKGISSILLAKKYGATVFAADLWIDPTENARRFESLGLGEQILPFRVDATQEIPFAEEYFDCIVSVDSYHYYGNTPEMFPKLLPYLKSGGTFAVAMPGVREDFPKDAIPEEMKPFWVDNMNFYSASWWEKLWWTESGRAPVTVCREMECLRRAWNEWLQSPNPYAKGDIPMMEAEGGKYFTLVQIIAEKK